MSSVRERYGEAHHEAEQQSELNQREYCEAQGIPAQGVRQPASEVKGRARAAVAQAALPSPQPKSCP
jgi:hypothetical protein